MRWKEDKRFNIESYRERKNKEPLAKEVLNALKGKIFDADVKVEDLPLFPEYGPGVYVLTEGPGEHKTSKSRLPSTEYPRYDVPAGHVYASIFDTGQCNYSTYKFTREESGTLELKSVDIHNTLNRG